MDLKREKIVFFLSLVVTLAVIFWVYHFILLFLLFSIFIQCAEIFCEPIYRYLVRKKASEWIFVQKLYVDPEMNDRAFLNRAFFELFYWKAKFSIFSWKIIDLLLFIKVSWSPAFFVLLIILTYFWTESFFMVPVSPFFSHRKSKNPK